MGNSCSCVELFGSKDELDFVKEKESFTSGKLGKII